MNDLDILMEPVDRLRRMVMNLPAMEREDMVIRIHKVRPSITIRLEKEGFALCDDALGNEVWYPGSLTGWKDGLKNPL